MKCEDPPPHPENHAKNPPPQLGRVEPDDGWGGEGLVLQRRNFIRFSYAFKQVHESKFSLFFAPIVRLYLSIQCESTLLKFLCTPPHAHKNTGRQGI